MGLQPSKQSGSCSFTSADNVGHIVRWPRTFVSADVDDLEETIPRRISPDPGHSSLDRLSSGTAVEAIEQLVQLLAELQLTPRRPRLAIKVDRRILFIDLNDVSAIEAEGNYVLLRAPNGSHLVRESISMLEKQLAPFGFVRIHRSALINSAFVDEIQPLATGEYVLRLRGGKEFRVTRTHKKNLKSLAPLWIGTDRLLDSVDRQGDLGEKQSDELRPVDASGAVE